MTNRSQKSGQRTAICHFSLVIFHWSFGGILRVFAPSRWIRRSSVFVQFVASFSRCKFVHSFSEVGGHGPGRGLRGSSWINGFSSGFDPRISVHPRPDSTGATCSSVFGVQRARAEILSQLLSPGARCLEVGQRLYRSSSALFTTETRSTRRCTGEPVMPL